MGEKEWDPSDVFDVFGDSLARRILVLASERPLSADDLAEQLDVSRPTIYRRVNALRNYDLLRERQQIDADGNHYQRFETTLKRVTLEIGDGGYDVSLTMRQRLAEQFESFWNDLEESKPEPAVDSEGDPTGSGIHHG
ncbi:MAG: HTH domain-containing protein [Halobacteriales archaeon]